MRSAIGEDRESRTCRIDSPGSPSTLCRVPRVDTRFIQSCIVKRQAEVRRFWIITILIGLVDSPELHGERYPRQVTLGCPKISHCMSKRRSRLSSSSIVLDYLQFKMLPRRQRRWRWRQRQRGEWRRSGIIFMRECFYLSDEHQFALVCNQQRWLRISHTRHVDNRAICDTTDWKISYWWNERIKLIVE